MSLRQKDQMPKAEMEGDALVISIGTEVLIHAAEYGRSYGEGAVKITNKKEFLENLKGYILSEEEDGFTPLLCMIDDCVHEMIEQGEKGLEYEYED